MRLGDRHEPSFARRWAPAWLSILFVLAACSPSLGPSGGAEVGEASWYGRRHQGKPTASGERYDERALTAAHPTLPLDSRAKVTNLENGKSVVVRVNDRGPFVDGRIIDLSRAAARALGIVESGVARVRVEPLR